MEKHSPRPRLDDLAHAADGEHNLAAYMVALLLYRHNGNADDDKTARRYIRWVEGEEESQSALDQCEIGSDELCYACLP
jgi:hypothetical protein